MEAQQRQQTQQTEKLIEDMLGFLDSTSEDEDDNSNMKGERNSPEESYESANEDFLRPGEENKGDSLLLGTNKKERKSKSNSIAKELTKIKNQFPIWNASELLPTSKKLTDPIWHQTYTPTDKCCDATDIENDWNSKLESNCRRSSSNSYVQEVNRAIYGDTTGHPPNGSPEYFQAAQNYAIYGKDFLDFPENLAPLLSEKVTSTPPETVPFVTGYGNGLYPTPPTPETSTGVGFTNFNKQSSSAAAAYYQMCNGLQPTSVRPAPPGSTAYGMFLGNKVTYVAAAPAAPPLVYNQHSSTTTNFISNSLANAALASSTAATILYSNPMLTTTTQQYLNTFFKETQYLSGATTQGTTVGTTTGIYERLIYAQMLQQQIYHQTQQQAAAVAAMFHKSRPTRTTTNGSAGGATASIACSNSATQNMPSTNSIPGVNMCGRQASMAANTSDLLVKSPPASSPIPVNGNDDNAAQLND